MASTLDELIKVAENHNNAAGLLALYEIDPPNFEEYSLPGQILTNWYGAEDWERDGSRVLRPIGLPHVILEFIAITLPEFTILKDLDGEVTVRLFNKDENEWHTYNGLWEVDPHDENEWDLDQWDKVTVNVWDLEEIA